MKDKEPTPRDLRQELAERNKPQEQARNDEPLRLDERERERARALT